MKNTKRGGGRMPYREPAHVERGHTSTNASMKSHGSPASIGASIGNGPMPGAGELQMPGPGPAGSKVVGRGENPTYPTPSGSPPAGMKVYREE